MRKRNKNKKQVKIVVGTVICLLLIMTVGYAAFSTDLTLIAKGNVKDTNAAWQLKKNVVTTGDGLYSDGYQEGRYVYRGTNPNNYIVFNDEQWKIISVEIDGTLKIIRINSLINNIGFDTKEIRKEGYCSLGNAPLNGCNSWGATEEYINKTFGGVVTTDSSLKTYLNDTYFSSFNASVKKLVKLYDFSYGSVENKNGITLETTIAQEKTNISKSNVGLFNVSDYIHANKNNKCLNVYENQLTGSECVTLNTTDNWLHNLGYNYSWTINAYDNTTDIVWFVNAYNSTNGRNGVLDFGNHVSAMNSVNPVVFLKSDIKLTGTGTETDPYIIK